LPRRHHFSSLSLSLSLSFSLFLALRFLRETVRRKRWRARANKPTQKGKRMLEMHVGRRARVDAGRPFAVGAAVNSIASTHRPIKFIN
jgi:hypothetical protein